MSSSGSWLGGPKKLWSSITSEVTNMFTEPQHATNKYDEQRVGQQSTRNYMSEFDQQLNRELGSSASSPQHSRYPSQPYINSSAPPAHYQQQSQIASPSGSWTGNGAGDMGLNPSLPVYQQQQLHHIPSAQPLSSDPNYPPQHQQQQHPYASDMGGAAHPYYPSIAHTTAAPQSLPSSPYPPATTYPPPTTSLPPGVTGPSHPAYPPRSPATPSTYSNHTTPMSPAQPPLSMNGAPAPLPYSPQPAPYQSTLLPTLQPNQHPYAQPSPYPNNSTAYPATSTAYPAPPPASTSTYPPPPSAAYMGPSFTSASYSSATSGALPPPPPSSYWVSRAAQQSSTAGSGGGSVGSVDGGGAAKVDYSDLDYSSMDFAYARKDRPNGAQ